MIQHEAKVCRGFVICRGFITKGEVFSNKNRHNCGEYNQFLYSVTGSGLANDTELPVDTLTDLSSMRGQEIDYRCTSDSAAWVAFNPLKEGTSLNVELFKGRFDGVILDEDKETFIIPLTSNVRINETSMKSLSIGRLLRGKSAHISMEDGERCVILSINKSE